MLLSANHVVGLIEIDVDAIPATPAENDLATCDETLLGFLRRVSSMTAEACATDDDSSDDFSQPVGPARRLAVSNRWQGRGDSAPAAQSLIPVAVYADFEQLAKDLDVEVGRLQRRFSECRR
jgi:hypothetical protein